MDRLEGLAKLTGRERYVDDLPLDDFLWGATVRSPAPRGRITDVRFGPGVDWSRFTIVDHRDLPGPNVIALIETLLKLPPGGFERFCQRLLRESGFQQVEVTGRPVDSGIASYASVESGLACRWHGAGVYSRLEVQS